MRIPFNRIAEYLPVNAPVHVRASDFRCFNADMPYTEALALAARGEVEGVVTKGGKVKYLRLLAEKEKPLRLEVEEIPAEKFVRNSGSVVARTEIGVYREQVCALKTDENGVRTRDVVARVWSFCALRRSRI